MEARHDTTDWVAIRGAYPGMKNGAYLDTSSLGLMAMTTVEAARAEQERLMMEGSSRYFHWHVDGRADITRVVAGHIGGEEAGTVLLPSFTTGMTRLAPMLRHRRKVLLVGGDYPTLHAPFVQNGFDVVKVEPDADGGIPMARLAVAMDRERPALVAISHVQWSSGHKVDLQELGGLCRAHGAWSMVDATQSWCSAPIDLRRTPVDILGASGYKWPLAGFGNGFFHLSATVRGELEERNGYKALAALSEGHLDPIAMVRLGDALGRAASIGADAVAERVDRLCSDAVERLDRAGVRVLSGRDPAARAGILIIEGGEDRLARMRQAGVQAQLRGAGIRIGVHFYNDGEDVERLVAAAVHNGTARPQ